MPLWQVWMEQLRKDSKIARLEEVHVERKKRTPKTWNGRHNVHSGLEEVQPPGTRFAIGREGEHHTEATTSDQDQQEWQSGLFREGFHHNGIRIQSYEGSTAIAQRLRQAASCANCASKVGNMVPACCVQLRWDHRTRSFSSACR
jgi:hypothetical protein